MSNGAEDDAKKDGWIPKKLNWTVKSTLNRQYSMTKIFL